MMNSDVKATAPSAPHLLAADREWVDRATMLAPSTALGSTSLSTPDLLEHLNGSSELFTEGTDQHIKIADIDVDFPRLRQLRSEAVLVIAGSIERHGLLQPLIVRRAAHGRRFSLVAGHHRLEAIRRLGWTSVRCRVLELDDLHAEVASIDENLSRGELSPAEWALHIVRRQELHERIHGSAKARGAHAANLSMGHHATAILADAFTSAAARLTGRSQRTIQRAIAAGKALGPEILAKISGTSLDRPSEIEALSKLPAEERAKLVEAAEDDNKISAVRRAKNLTGSEALTVKTDAAETSSVVEPSTIDDQFKALLEAWQRASEPAKDKFLSWLGAGQ